MTRILTIVSLIFFLCAGNGYAGLYSSGYNREGGTVIAAVQIKEKGIYNLIVNIQFLHRPQKGKIYSSDEYEKLIDRLLVESRGIALHKILENTELALGDLLELKNAIETGIEKLATQLKKKLLPDQDVEVVFAISDIYLLEPADK